MAWQTLVAGGAAALPRLLYTVKTVVKQAYSGLNLSHRGFKRCELFRYVNMDEMC